MKKLAAAIIASSVSLIAMAASLDPSAKKTIEGTIHKLDPNARILGYFAGPDDFAGLVVKGKDDPKPSVIWTTRDGKYLIAGNLIEADTSRNLTDVAAEHYKAANPVNLLMNEVVEMTVKRILPKSAQLAALDAMKKGEMDAGTPLDDNGLDQIKPVVSGNEAARIAKSRVDSGAAIILGDKSSGKIAHVFFDPRCPHCREFYQSVAGRLGKDGIKWVFIPVAFINDESSVIARTLLKHGDKKALDALVLPEGAKLFTEKVELLTAPDKKLDKLMEENRKALSDILGGNLAVPTVIIKTDGKARVLVGPNDGDSVAQAMHHDASKEAQKKP